MEEVGDMPESVKTHQMQNGGCKSLASATREIDCENGGNSETTSQDFSCQIEVELQSEATSSLETKSLQDAENEDEDSDHILETQPLLAEAASQTSETSATESGDVALQIGQAEASTESSERTESPYINLAEASTSSGSPVIGSGGCVQQSEEGLGMSLFKPDGDDVTMARHSHDGNEPSASIQDSEEELERIRSASSNQRYRFSFLSREQMREALNLPAASRSTAEVCSSGESEDSFELKLPASISKASTVPVHEAPDIRQRILKTLNIDKIVSFFRPKTSDRRCTVNDVPEICQQINDIVNTISALMPWLLTIFRKIRILDTNRRRLWEERAEQILEVSSMTMEVRESLEEFRTDDLTNRSTFEDRKCKIIKHCDTYVDNCTVLNNELAHFCEILPLIRNTYAGIELPDLEKRIFKIREVLDGILQGLRQSLHSLNEITVVEAVAVETDNEGNQLSLPARPVDNINNGRVVHNRRILLPSRHSFRHIPNIIVYIGVVGVIIALAFLFVGLLRERRRNYKENIRKRSDNSFPTRMDELRSIVEEF